MQPSQVNSQLRQFSRRPQLQQEKGSLPMHELSLNHQEMILYQTTNHQI